MAYHSTAQSIAGSSITASYTLAASAPNKDSIVSCVLTGNLDEDVWISFDGTNDHYFLQSGGNNLAFNGDRSVNHSQNVYVKHAGVQPAADKKLVITYIGR